MVFVVSNLLAYVNKCKRNVKQLFCVLILFFLLVSNLFSQSRDKLPYSNLHIYALGKNTSTTSRITKNTIKQVSSYHTIITNKDIINKFQNIQSSSYETGEAIEQEKDLDVRLLFEFCNDKDTSRTIFSQDAKFFAIGSIILKGNDDNEMLQQLKDYLPPRLRWYKQAENESNSVIKDSYDYNTDPDGYVLEFLEDPNLLLNNKLYLIFEKDEILQILEEKIITFHIEVNVNKKKIEGIKIDDRVAPSYLSSNLNTKLLGVLMSNLIIKSIKNQYGKKNDIIYRWVTILPKISRKNLKNLE